MTLEASVEDTLVRLAHEYGCKAEKMYTRGWPDRMVLWPVGVVEFVELKRPVGGRFEPLQLRTHDTLRKMGFTVLVLNTTPKVNLYFQQTAAKLGVQRKPKQAKLLSAHEYIRSLRKPA